MAKFSLLNKLQRIDENGPEQVSHIKYQKYVIAVDNNDVNISIPVRECSNFEQGLEEYEKLSRDDLRVILRKHRGLLSD